MQEINKFLGNTNSESLTETKIFTNGFDFAKYLIPPTAYPSPSTAALFYYLQMHYYKLLDFSKTTIEEIDSFKVKLQKLLEINQHSLDELEKELVFHQEYNKQKHIFKVNSAGMPPDWDFGYAGNRQYNNEWIYFDSLFGFIVEHNGKICLKISFEPDFENNSLLVCQLQGGLDARSVAGFMDLFKSAIKITQKVALTADFDFVDVVSTAFHKRYYDPDHPQFDSSHTAKQSNLDEQYIKRPRINGFELFIPKVSEKEKKVRRRILARTEII
ncbi:MAG: hypothetical protein OHK0017_07200 [Patescibacteria group bacterium]